MGVAACQMEKKGIATEKGELNRNIKRQTALSGKSGRRLGSSRMDCRPVQARETARNSRNNLPTLQIC